MKYYLVYLLRGQVVRIDSYDTQDVRDRHYSIATQITAVTEWDNVQAHNEIR
jgi:hypothetical protein